MRKNIKILKAKNYDIILENYFYFFILIAPILTIYDDTQAVIRVLVLQIIFISMLLIKKDFIKLIKQLLNNNKVTVIILASFLISTTISFIISPAKVEHWGFNFVRQRYLELIVYFFFFIFIFVYLSKTIINFKKFITVIICSSLIFVNFIYIQGFLKSGSEIYKLLSLYSEIRGPGLVLTSFVSCFVGYLTLSNNNINYKDILILSLLLSLVYYFGGRGNLLSIFIICALSMIYKKIINQKYYSLFLTFLISFSLAWIILKTIVFLYSIGTDNIQGTYSLIRIEKKDFYDRIEIWIASFNLLKDSLLFGYGPNAFLVLQSNNLLTIEGWWIKSNMFPTHTHNFIFQFLVEWGLIGTLLILFLMTKNILKGIIILIKKQNKYLIIPVLNVAGLTAHGMVDGTYIHPVTVTFLLISNAMIAANVKFK